MNFRRLHAAEFVKKSERLHSLQYNVPLHYLRHKYKLFGGGMKQKFCLMMLALVLCGVAAAQDNDKVILETQERFFLPKDTLWGYAQFDLAPPHNEIDPNLC